MNLGVYRITADSV